MQKYGIIFILCVYLLIFIISTESVKDDFGEINISGLDKRVLFSALYANAPVVGGGALHPLKNNPLTDEDFIALENNNWDVDYYHGHCMKIDISGDTMQPWLYDRNSQRPAAEIVAALRMGHSETEQVSAEDCMKKLELYKNDKKLIEAVVMIGIIRDSNSASDDKYSNRLDEVLEIALMHYADLCKKDRYDLTHRRLVK